MEEIVSPCKFRFRVFSASQAYIIHLEFTAPDLAPCIIPIDTGEWNNSAFSRQSLTQAVPHILAQFCQ